MAPPRILRTLQSEFPWAFPAPKRNPPVHVARVGNVRVPVYRYGDGRFCVAWRQVDGEKLKRETFPRKPAAVERAEEIAKAVANSLADVVTLSSADRDNYRLAAQALAPFGTPLHAAISEYVAAKNKIGGHTLMEAVNFFVRGHVDRLACPPTAEIVTKLLAELADDRREARKYVAPLKRDLDRFARTFRDLRDATEDATREYLRSLKLQRAFRGREAGEPVSARRRDNVREAIVRLMRFARKKGYLPEDKMSAVERIARLSEGGEVTTYNAEQLADILHHFATRDRDWLPWAAIAAFAGLRTSEILRLDWSALRWASSVIAVSRAVARKVRVARQAPILDPLGAWLASWRDASGPVIPRKWKDLEAAHSDALARLRKALKWESWDNNALRHSFGSNRLAVVKSYAQVSLEMGNSPAKVREHYNDPKPEAEAIRYFAVLPAESVRNVIAMRGANFVT